MSYQVALTLVSRNVKTGPIPVSTTTFDTCPDACPLRNNGCYAGGGPLAIYWRKVTEGKAGVAFADFVKQVARLPKGILWRHNQAGDLAGNRVQIDAQALSDLVRANKGKRGFTYTHYNPKVAGNADAIRDANAQGFTINLSGNSLAHADALADADCGPVVTILPADMTGKRVISTPKGRKVVVCPATYRDDVSCASCGLCAISKRNTIVGFPAHGNGKRKADAISKA